MLLEPNPPEFPAPWAVAWGEDLYGLWQAFEIEGVRQVMRWIVPGRFLMGSPHDEEGRFNSELQHELTLSNGFWLAETACSQALWRAVTGGNPSRFTGHEDFPVENVSWNDCRDFINLANEHLETELALRLPTEAEWEYACRAGTTTAFNFSGELDLERSNYRGIWEWRGVEWAEGARHSTGRVKKHSCNRWGLYQMQAMFGSGARTGMESTG